MEFALLPDTADGYPIIAASGPISEESLIDLGRFVRSACDQGKARGAIIDCAGIEGALSAESIFRATPAYTVEVGRDIRVAYINPPAHWRPADDQFSRDLAYNRGGFLELFENLPDAVRWLGKD